MKVFVAGHKGMVGSAICRKLIESKDTEVITKTRQELDLTKQIEVKNFFESHKFDQVYLAAAKVGGIHANSHYPADFIYENLAIQINTISSAFHSGVNKLLFLGSSCIYPKDIPQPMNEKALLTGELESTNEPYAIAKIAGIKLCESYNRQYGVDYRSVMPTNLYGENDNFHPENSHVIPGLIQRFHEAKINGAKNVKVWGSGTVSREFLHVDDMADASIFIMNLDKKKYHSRTKPMLSHINVGFSSDCTIKELADLISDAVDYDGGIVWDKSKPDGPKRKLMCTKVITDLGWKPKIDLKTGLRKTYKWYLKNQSRIKAF